MTVWVSLRTRVSTWIDDVAVGLTRLGAMVRRSRRIELVEQVDGSFLVVDVSKQAAGRAEGPSLRIDESEMADPISLKAQLLLARSSVDVMLAPSRFIIRSLELPQGARQFLEGVVRSQIDRLTPWSANEAAFGWSEPTDQATDKSPLQSRLRRDRSSLRSRGRQSTARADQVRMATRIGEGRRL